MDHAQGAHRSQASGGGALAPFSACEKAGEYRTSAPPSRCPPSELHPGRRAQSSSQFWKGVPRSTCARRNAVREPSNDHAPTLHMSTGACCRREAGVAEGEQRPLPPGTQCDPDQGLGAKGSLRGPTLLDELRLVQPEEASEVSCEGHRRPHVDVKQPADRGGHDGAADPVALGPRAGRVPWVDLRLKGFAGLGRDRPSHPVDNSLLHTILLRHLRTSLRGSTRLSQEAALPSLAGRWKCGPRRTPSPSQRLLSGSSFPLDSADLYPGQSDPASCA
jgi:hypothetical protein